MLLPVYGGLEGQLQSVPRVELKAIVASNQINKANELALGADPTYLIRGVQRSKAVSMLSTHDDLWWDWWQAQEARSSGQATVSKIKAHCTDDDVLAGRITKQDLEGNKFADHFAGLGAQSIAFHREDLKRVAWTDARAWRIQRRIIACYANFLKLCPCELEHSSPRSTTPLPKGTAQNLQWVASQSGHELQVDGSVWRCVHCLRSSGRYGLRKLASQPCEVVQRHCNTRQKSPSRSGGRKAFWKVSTQLVLKHSTKQEMRSHPTGARHSIGQLGTGRATLHPSHNLAGTRGFIWCWRCGAYATRVPRLLVEPCRETGRVTCRAMLSRIRAGQTPFPSMKRWPCR